MCGRTMHSYKPRGLCGWLQLCCSYIPCVIACLLIFLNVLPFHSVYLPYLQRACVEGTASWLFYYYALLMMVFAEVMVYGNYILAVITPPGFVPHEPWCKAPVYAGQRYSDNPFEITELDRWGKMRYCNRCEQFKPDGAHHCSTSGRCVYAFDHFCPWVANAIGRDNYKYFLLFLAYIPVGAFHIVFMTSYSCYAHFGKFMNLSLDGVGDLYPSLVFVVSIMFSTCMGICFGCFAMHFLYMAYRGSTTVSVHISRKKTEVTTGGTKAERARAADLETMRRHAAKERHLYDVFGADRRWWRMMFCFAPVRDERGLIDETMPNYAVSIQRLV